MWRFYGRVVRRTPKVFLQSLRRMDTGSGVLTLIFVGAGFATWQQILPFWAPYAAFGVILLYGFLQATYEESQRVAVKTAFDASKLKAYESRDTDNLVFELLPSRDYTNQPATRRDSEDYAECLVPYDGEYVGVPGSRKTFSVGALGAEYSVTLSHEAYETPDPRDWSQPVEPFDVETHLYVVRCSGEEESVHTRLCVFSERGMVPKDAPRSYQPRWGYAISGTVRLLGLPQGRYGFEVHDRTNAPGRNIIFRYMRLEMYRLGSGASA
jgi:hypothetical protein